MGRFLANKRSVPRLYGALFSLALLLLPGAAFGAFWLANPSSVKSQLEKSNVYDLVSRSIIDQSALDLSGRASNNNLSTESFKRAMQKVVTPKIVKQKAEEYIDHNYAWLDNKKAKPMNFPDITNERRQLSRELGKEFSFHFMSMPLCGADELNNYSEQLKSNTLSISCRIPGVSRESVETLANNKIDEDLKESFSHKPMGNQGNKTKTVGVSSVVSGGRFELGPFAKFVYWLLRHGLMMVLSIILVMGAVAAASIRSLAGWLSWSGRSAVGAAVSILVAILPIAAITQIDYMSKSIIPEEYRSVVMTLTQPLVVISLVTLAFYVFFGLFAIVVAAKKGGDGNEEGSGGYGRH